MENKNLNQDNGTYGTFINLIQHPKLPITPKHNQLNTVFFKTINEESQIKIIIYPSFPITSTLLIYVIEYIIVCMNLHLQTQNKQEVVGESENVLRRNKKARRGKVMSSSTGGEPIPNLDHIGSREVYQNTVAVVNTCQFRQRVLPE